jgi:hypothetical protein
MAIVQLGLASRPKSVTFSEHGALEVACSRICPGGQVGAQGHRVRQLPLDAMPCMLYIIPPCVITSGSADRFCTAAVPFEGLNDAAADAAVELDSTELHLNLYQFKVPSPGHWSASSGAGNDS